MPFDWLKEKLKFPAEDVGIITRAIKSKLDDSSKKKKETFKVEKKIPDRKSEETYDYLKNYLSLRAKKITGGISSAIGEAQITKDIATIGRTLPETKTPFEAIREMTKPIKEKVIETGRVLPETKTPFEAIREMTIKPIKEYLKPKPPTDLPALDFYDKLQDVKDRPEQLVPFVASGSEAINFGKLLTAANRLKEDTASEEDISLLQEYVDHNSRDTSYGYKVLDVVSMMPSFMGELLATSGVATAGRTVTMKGAKETLKFLLTKKGKDLLEKRASKFGLKVVAEVGARTLQAPVAGVTRIASDTLEKQLQGTLGELVGAEEKEDLWSSATKAFGAQWVETLSEFSGGLFKPLSKPIKNQLLKASLFGAFQKANPTAKLDDLAAIVGKLGYHGVLSEMLEERMADVGHGTLYELGLGDQEFSLPSGEQLAVEFAAFSVPGVAFTAVNQLDPTLNKVREYLKKVKPGLTIEAVDEKAPTENYNEWLRKQPEALKKIKEYDENAKTITNEKDRIKYLKNAKHEFDTEFSKKFAEREDEIKRFQFVSPNVKEGLTFEDATKNLETDSYKKNFKAVENAYLNDGLDGELRTGMGDWADGAEETYIKEVISDVSDEQAIYSLAKKSKELEQKDAIDFKTDINGKDELYLIDPVNKTVEELRNILNNNGIEFKTLGDDRLYVINSGEYFDKNMIDKMKEMAYNEDIDIVKRNGVATFITGVEDRDAARKIYNNIIINYEKKYDIQRKPTDKYKADTISRKPVPRKESPRVERKIEEREIKEVEKIKPTITEKVSEAGFIMPKKAVPIAEAIKAREVKIPVTKMTKAIREFIGEKPSPLVAIRKRKATVIKERIIEMQKEAKRKISKKGKIARTIDEMIIEKEKAVRKAELKGGKNVIIQRFKALEKGLREGRSLTRKEIEAVQTEVIDLLDASMLEKNDKAKFIRAIKNIQTTEQLRKALPVIQERIETLTEKASKRTLKAQIKKELENTKVRKQAGKPVGKFTPEVQKNLNMLREASRLTKKEADIKIQESLEKYDRGTIPEDVALENKILNMISGMDNMTVGELKYVLNQIRIIKNTGRLTAELKKFNRQTDIDMWVNKAINVITGGKDIPENISTIGVKELSPGELKEQVQKFIGTILSKEDSIRIDDIANMLKTSKEKAQKFVGTIGKDFVGWDDIIDMLSRKTKSKPGETWLDTFSDTTMQENAVKKGWRINLLGKGKARKMADEAFKFKSDREMVRQFQDDAIEVSLGIFKNAEGTMSEIIYTKSEARKAWMELQDPTLEETFKTGMNYTDEIVEAIDGFLTEEDKSFARKQLDFYREYYNSVNKIYRDIYGTDLPFNEFYSPVKREGIARDEVIGFGEFLQEIPVRESITSGSLKNRIKNIKPLKKQSDISALEQHVTEMEHFKAWAFKIRDFKAVFGDPMVRASIIREHGKDMLGMVDNFINDFTRGGEELASRLNWLDKLRGNFSRAVLAIKPSIGIKQLTSFVAYADTIPAKDFGIGFADFWSNPLEKIKILGKSEMMKARGKHMERDIKTAISSDAYASFRKNPSFLNSLMLNIQIGDQGAIYVGGWSVYRYHRKQGKFHEEALKIFEKVTSNTQQSSDLSKQSYWQRGGSFAKLFTMFKSAPNQFFRKELGALRNLAHGRITTKQFAKTVAIYHVIIPMMFQFVSDWFRWDPEEQKRAVIVGPFNGIFIIGDGLAYLVRGALDLRQFPSEIPLYSIPRDFDKVTKLISDDDITTEDIFRAIRGLAGSIGAVKGYPLKQSIDITTGIKEILESEYDSGLAKFLGWSPYIAEKTTEKETTLKLPTRSLPTR